MVEVILYDGGIKCTGHAENDVVCGMFTFACINMMKGFNEVLHISPEYYLAPGRFDLYTDDLDEKAMILYDTFIISLKQLAEDYKRSFNITIIE